MAATFNGIVSSIYGQGVYVLVPLPPAPPVFYYRPIEPPKFLNDTLIIELNGDIAIFEPGCEMMHPLPPPDVREYDFELEISAASPFCILNQLSSMSPFISTILSGQLLAPPLSFTYDFPFDNNSYSFVPRTHSSSFSINPLFIDLSVSFLNGTGSDKTPAMDFNASLEISMINVELLLPNWLSINTSANLNSLMGAVSPGWMTPYSDQIEDEKWSTIIDMANVYIHALPTSLNFSLPDVLESIVKDIAFDTGSQWVTIGANIK